MQGDSHGGDGGFADAANQAVGLLLRGSGRLTSAAHRLKVIELSDKANVAGAGLFSAYRELGNCLRTFTHWRQVYLGHRDGMDRFKAVLARSFAQECGGAPVD